MIVAARNGGWHENKKHGQEIYIHTAEEVSFEAALQALKCKRVGTKAV